MRNLLKLLIFFAAIPSFAVSCDDGGNTGQAMVAYTIHAKGSGTTSFTTEDGWSVTLTEARLAFGPLELCAHVPTFNVKDSMTGCGVVMGQFSEGGVIDGLDTSAQELGMVQGIEGEVHSVSYDLGVSWPSTQSEPVTVVDDLGGASVRIQGEATKDGSTVPFVFEVTVKPSNQGLFAVRGIPAEGDVTTSTTDLVVSTDPVEWLRYVDWDEVLDSYDGTDAVTAEEGSTIYNAVYYGITVGRPMSFEWK